MMAAGYAIDVTAENYLFFSTYTRTSFSYVPLCLLLLQSCFFSYRIWIDWRIFTQLKCRLSVWFPYVISFTSYLHEFLHFFYAPPPLFPSDSVLFESQLWQSSAQQKINVEREQKRESHASSAPFSHRCHKPSVNTHTISLFNNNPWWWAITSNNNKQQRANKLNAEQR